MQQLNGRRNSKPKPSPLKSHEEDPKTEGLLLASIEHAANGYKNAQETIRFIDTKSTFLTGASTLTLGFVLEGVKRFLELPNAFKASFDGHPYYLLVLELLTSLSLFLGGMCLWCCIMSIVGRPPVRPRDTILFPFFSGKSEEITCCSRISSGVTRLEIAREYEIQVRDIGFILRKKLIRHRWAAWMFLAQLMALMLGGILVVLCLC